MSVISIPYDKGYEWLACVGWDNPENTFFAQVFDAYDDELLFSVGAFDCPIASVDELIKACEGHISAKLIEASRDRLERDKNTAPDLTPLQKKMLSILKNQTNIET